MLKKKIFFLIFMINGVCNATDALPQNLYAQSQTKLSDDNFQAFLPNIPDVLIKSLPDEKKNMGLLYFYDFIMKKCGLDEKFNWTLLRILSRIDPKNYQRFYKTCSDLFFLNAKATEKLSIIWAVSNVEPLYYETYINAYNAYFNSSSLLNSDTTADDRINILNALARINGKFYYILYKFFDKNPSFASIVTPEQFLLAVYKSNITSDESLRNFLNKTWFKNKGPYEVEELSLTE